MKALLATTALALGLATAAHAEPILTFGQTASVNTITAIADASGTTLTGTNVRVNITQIDNSSPLPPSFPHAFFDLSATSSSAGAIVLGGGGVVEHFTGSFSVTSGPGDTGTNYLSGTFSDAAITAIGATEVALAAPTTDFTSDVISTLGLPRAIGFTLTNVTPKVSLASAPGTDSGETLASFRAAVSGNAAASVVPEPAALGLLGVGLLGLGLSRRRRSQYT